MANARKLIREKPEMSIRELVLERVMMLGQDKAEFPYVWWVSMDWQPVLRAIYLDDIGCTFVKLEHHWRRAYSIQRVGALVGALGAAHYEDLSVGDYFIAMQSEEQAREYF